MVYGGLEAVNGSGELYALWTSHRYPLYVRSVTVEKRRISCCFWEIRKISRCKAKKQVCSRKKEFFFFFFFFLFFFFFFIIIIIISRRYNPWWVVACFTILFHNLLSLHFSLQFLTFIFFRSPSTWSSHLSLGLPTDFDEHGSHSVSFLTVLVVSIRITCAAQRNLCDFINRKKELCQEIMSWNERWCRKSCSIYHFAHDDLHAVSA